MNSQNFSGADLDQLRALSSRLKSQSGKMREVANSSTFALMAAEWTGGEIDAIRDQWRRNSLPTITRLADSLEQLGSDLDQHVAEQERVSAGGSGGPLGNLIDWIRRSIDRFIDGIVGPGQTVPPEAAPTEKGGDSASDPNNGSASPAPAATEDNKGATIGVLHPPSGGRDAYVAEMGAPPYPVYRGTLDGLGAYKGECTSWVAWRRSQLGLPYNDGGGTGHGGEMASRLGGSSSNPPTLGAVVSNPNEGHVMIIEEIFPDGSFRVSEMNISGVEGSVRDTKVWRPNPDGTYGGPQRLIIAP